MKMCGVEHTAFAKRFFAFVALAAMAVAFGAAAIKDGTDMTFEQLDALHPNGFDDAYIDSLRVDYQNRTAELRLSLRGNPPGSPNADDYERAVLLLDGFYYLVIEPPDADHLWYPVRSIQINGYPEDASQFPLFENLKPKLPTGAFCCRFYVHDWNAFIHVAARDAQLSWLEDGDRAKSRVAEP